MKHRRPVLIALLMIVALFCAFTAEAAVVRETSGGTLSAPLKFTGTTNSGLTVNRLTTAQRNALGDVDDGTVIFNTTTGVWNFYDGTTWLAFVPTTGGAISGTSVYPDSVLRVTDNGTDGGGAISGTATGNTGVGLYGYSSGTNGAAVSFQATGTGAVGAFGGSLHSHSALFRPIWENGVTNNFSVVRIEPKFDQAATVYAWQIGEAFGDPATDTKAACDFNGDCVERSVKLTGGTRPTCDASARFTFWTVAGGAGVKDTVEVCAKDAGDAYAWRTIY